VLGTAACHFYTHLHAQVGGVNTGTTQEMRICRADKQTYTQVNTYTLAHTHTHLHTHTTKNTKLYTGW